MLCATALHQQLIHTSQSVRVPPSSNSLENATFKTKPNAF